MESLKPEIREIIQKSYPQIKELNPAQKAVVDAGFMEDDHNYILAIPTASGKTLLGVMAALDSLKKGGKDVELSPEACARKVGGSYYLRMNRRGEIYNPLDSAHTSMSHKHSEGIPVWRYVNVSYAAFKNYSMFLSTRNPIYLTWARRELGS